MWDMTIDRMPGQADEYDTLPLYGGVDCRLIFFADKEGYHQRPERRLRLAVSGKRVGGQNQSISVMPCEIPIQAFNIFREPVGIVCVKIPSSPATRAARSIELPPGVSEIF